MYTCFKLFVIPEKIGVVCMNYMHLHVNIISRVNGWFKPAYFSNWNIASVS